jgi:hypothetical protein
MADYLHNHIKPYRGREQPPLRSVTLDHDQRLIRRLRILLEADERRLRPRPITLARSAAGDRNRGWECSDEAWPDRAAAVARQ